MIKETSYRVRVRAVQAELIRRKLDGLVVIKPEHVRYLSGIWGYSNRTEYAMPRRLIAVVVPKSGEPTVIVPKIELLFAKRRTWISDVRHHVEWSSGSEAFGGLDLLNEVLKEKQLIGQRIGLELGFVSARLFAVLAECFPTTNFEDGQDVIEGLRIIKTDEEIAIMRLGGQMVASELQAELLVTAAGKREFEIANVGREEASRRAAELTANVDAEIPLDHPMPDGIQIITSGPRLDMVHAPASTRALRKDDVILFDFCRVPQFENYRIGFSRMATLQQLTKEQLELASVVSKAYDSAVSLLRPGIIAEQPDIAARNILREAGLDDSFVHRTGRGVGLEGVERPEIGAGDKTELRSGMVVTIEPSIYFAGFAVHVEDTYLITDTGSELLTDYPRDIEVLGFR